MRPSSQRPGWGQGWPCGKEEARWGRRGSLGQSNVAAGDTRHRLWGQGSGPGLHLGGELGIRMRGEGERGSLRPWEDQGGRNARKGTGGTDPRSPRTQGPGSEKEVGKSAPLGL